MLWERDIGDPRELGLLTLRHLRAAYSEKSSAYRWPPHFHRRLTEFHYVDQGRLTWRCRGRRFTVAQGQAALFLPGQPHAAEGDPAAPPNTLVVQFAAPGLLRWLPGLRSAAGRPLTLDAVALAQVDALCAHMRRSDRASALQAAAAVQGLLVRLAGEPEGAGSPAGRAITLPVSRLADAASAWIRAHLGERLSLPRIATGLGVSVSTLVHRHRRETGETVHRLVLRERVARAKDRLRRGASVKEAAFAAGFSSPTALIRAFRRIERTTPGAYRQTRATAR